MAEELSLTIALSAVWDGPLHEAAEIHISMCRWCQNWSLIICAEPESEITEFGYQLLVEEGGGEHEAQCKPDLTSPGDVMGWLTT